MPLLDLDFAGLFDCSPNPYLVLDRRLYIVGANRAYLDSVKRDLADIVGRWAWDAFPTDPHTERLAIESFERVIRSGKADTMALLRFDVPRPEAEGGGFSKHYWSITHTPVVGPGGEVALVLQNPVDVTELEEARELAEAGSIDRSRRATKLFERAESVVRDNLTLKAATEQFTRLFEQAPSFMALLTGPSHVFELANPGYLDLIGHRDVIGHTVADALGEAVEQGYVALLDRVYATSEPYTANGARWTLRSGPDAPDVERYIDFVYQPISGMSGEVIGIFVQGVDTTERVLGEQALRESAERLRLVIEGAHDHAILTIDTEGSITTWSTGAADIFGWTSEEAVGQPVALIFTPEDRAERRDRHEMEMAAAHGCANDERWHMRKDGGRVFMNGSVYPLPLDADGRTQGFLKIARDETERRRTDQDLRDLNETLEVRVTQRTSELLAAEEQLRQSQKVEAVGQLTGGVAHDFNNLLTVIRGSVDLLRRPGISEERRTRYVDAIAETADRAARLTNQLLAFARRQSLKPSVFDARKNVATLQDMLRTLAGSRIEIALVTPEGACAVNADPSQFDTAIVNMAVNARDAMGGVGKLIIRVATVAEMPSIRAHPVVKGEFVAVSLTDTGSGIPADKIDHIFEPFFTTKGIGQGTGLGLSQVFGFAKQSGGEVAVKSRSGEGATFTLYLPRAQGGLDDAATFDTDAATLGYGACVLVVEDNADVGVFATEALQELGYKTHLATDAQLALDILRDDAGSFDVVFSDVVMPGMSGIELGQEVRHCYPNLPVVLTSGYSTVLAESGTHGFELLQKPYSVDELSRVLRKAAAWRARARGDAPQADR